MKQFSNFDKAKENARQMGGTSAQLPEGGYVAKIMGVRYEEGQNGNSDKILIQYDISEGEYKDFFKKAYEENTRDDKKWKGKATIYYPKDDGSEKDQWTKNAFAKWINAFEDSNNGYSWDWDENKWKGLSIGLIYGSVSTMIEGKAILYTEARFPASVEDIRSGNYKIPKLKEKAGSGVVSANDMLPIPADGPDEIPF